MKSQKSQTWVSDWTATAPTTFMQMVPNFKTFVDQKEKKPTSILYPKIWTSCFYFLMQILLFSCKYSDVVFISKGNQQLHRKAHYTPWSCPFTGTWFWNCRGSTVSPEGHGKMFKLVDTAVWSLNSPKKHLSFYFYLYMFSLVSQRSLRHCRSFGYFECFCKVLMASNELTFDHIQKILTYTFVFI